MNLSAQELLKLHQDSVAFASDPDYQLFKDTPPSKRIFLGIGVAKLESFFLHDEKMQYFSPEKIQKALADLQKQVLEQQRQEMLDIQSYLERPTSKLSCGYFRRHLNSPFFYEWRNRYAALMSPAHVNIVDRVKSGELGADGTFPFDWDENPQPKRNYPKRRKERDGAKESRMAILEYVKTHPHATDAEIGDAVGLKHAAVSKHIKVLKDEGIIWATTIRRWEVVNRKGDHRWFNQRTITLKNAL